LLRANRGEIDAVIAHCHKRLEQDDPDAPLILESLAVGCMVAMRWSEATAYLDRWLRRDPDHPQALFLRGRLEFLASNQQEAIGLFRRVVDLDPERADARLLLAGLHVDLGQAQEALPHLEWLRWRRPQNALVQTRLARCLDLLGRGEEATPLLDDVLARQPDLAPALLERGKLALRAGDLDMARDLLQKACERDPGSYDACYQLHLCLKQLGRDAEARAALERMNQLQQDILRMRDITRNALFERPNDAALHAELGELCLRVGAPEQAVRWLEGALRLDPNNAAAHRGLARYYQGLGQYGLAERHRAQAGTPESLAAPSGSK
jgi:tetratricopeptide (TPR) repeat protein